MKSSNVIFAICFLIAALSLVGFATYEPDVTGYVATHHPQAWAEAHSGERSMYLEFGLAILTMAGMSLAFRKKLDTM